MEKVDDNFYMLSDKQLEKLKQPSDIELLQQDNAELWYDNMLKDIKIEQSETEIAQLWYELMMGSVA